jgi:hypothetical protein
MMSQGIKADKAKNDAQLAKSWDPFAKLGLRVYAATRRTDNMSTTALLQMRVMLPASEPNYEQANPLYSQF